MTWYYDKDKIKNELTLNQIFELLETWGGNPTYSPHGIISRTICHNNAEEGSYKLYYYDNSKLFRCYTHCNEAFDVFELIIKIMKIQLNEDWDLHESIRYIVNYFGIKGTSKDSSTIQSSTSFLEVFKNKEKIRKNLNTETFQTKEIKFYDKEILSKFLYPRILPWEREGIKDSVIKDNFIGFYPKDSQITIPHFDINNNLIGVRGRTLIKDKAILYGKYRPIVANKILYTHPLSLNLYNLNNSKKNISISHTAIIFESEKSCLMYQSYYGKDNDISVACCGSNISDHQIMLLEKVGAKNLIIAFDRQFQKIGDLEYLQLKDKMFKLFNKYGQQFNIAFILDIQRTTPYKASPIDYGKEVFEKLLSNSLIEINDKTRRFQICK